MMTAQEMKNAQKKAARFIAAARFPIRREEVSKIEVADFGLGHLENEGAQILTVVQSSRIAAKVIVLFPGQTLPEHWHPPWGDDPGKEETVRVIGGSLSVCTPGEPGMTRAKVPAGKDALYTCRSERILAAGDQCFLSPGTAHWFQAGPRGAVAWSFSSVARDSKDRFTDPNVVRATVVRE